MGDNMSLIQGNNRAYLIKIIKLLAKLAVALRKQHQRGKKENLTYVHQTSTDYLHFKTNHFKLVSFRKWHISVV